MRGLVDRRAIAILSRGPGACFQRLSFSAAGRGRGRGDVEDAPVPEFGAGDGAVGRGLGLGSLGAGRGRGRGSVLPSSPSSVASQPLPTFKPFSLRPTESSVAEKRENAVPEAEKTESAADSRFEDAVAETDVAKQSEIRVSSDAVSEGGGGNVSNASGGVVLEAAGGDGSEAGGEEPERLLSFRGLLNISPPGGHSQEGTKAVPFNPFNLPTTPSPSIFGIVAGRGRGAPLPQGEGAAGRGRGAPRPSRDVQQAPIGAEGMKGEEAAPVHVQLSREEARARAMALLAKGEVDQGRRRAASPSPPASPTSAAPSRPPLSREDAVQRAVAVMNEGVERNLSREEERRRRRGAVDSFSDATTMVADRFRRRAPDSQPQQARGPQSAKERSKRQQPRFIQRRDQEEEPQVPLTLREMTAEDEKRLIILEEEEQFKSNLHSKFLVDFEPEYAMEYFGSNPDIDELPQKSLEEILADAKPFLMAEGMTDEQWDGEVKDVLEKAPHLENLVNLYAGGPSRVTAWEQASKLKAVADTMPAHAAPEIHDFMSQALLTLQSNPGIRMKEKERLMNKFVSGFSSF